MAEGQGYIPSFAELMRPTDPNAGTVQPGYAAGRNEGIALLVQAATAQAQLTWEKHKDIQDRKAAYFEKLSDISQLETMAEDKGVLRDKLSGLLKMMVAPNVLNGRDEKAQAEFQAAILDFGQATATSKQDLLNYRANQKIIAENKEYQNKHNERSQQDFVKKGLGQRTYDPLMPTPEFDAKVALAPALAGVMTATEPTYQRGKYEKDPVTGKQVFKPSDTDYTHEIITSGGQKADQEKYNKQADAILNNPLLTPMLTPWMQFQFEELNEDQKKAVSVDGKGLVPDYEKMKGVLKEQYKPQDVAGVAGAPQESKMAQERIAHQYRLGENEANDRRALARAIAVAKIGNEVQVEKMKNTQDYQKAFARAAAAYGNRIADMIGKGVVQFNGINAKGIPLSQLSPLDRRRLGLEAIYQGNKVSRFADIPEKNIIIVSRNGGKSFSIEQIDKEGNSVKPLDTFDRESMGQSMIDYEINRGQGNESLIAVGSMDQGDEGGGQGQDQGGGKKKSTWRSKSTTTAEKNK